MICYCGGMEIAEAIEKSGSMRAAALLLNIPFSSFKRKASALGLYLPNRGGKNLPGERKAVCDILVLKSSKTRTGRIQLKRALLEIGRKYECEKCGQSSTWNDEELILHIDHRNGVRYDDRQENLRFLCPNCHSQTTTFGFKGRKHSEETKQKLRNCLPT